MRSMPFILAALVATTLCADTQKPKAPAQDSRESHRKDIVRILASLGWPKANAEAARKQLEAAAKDPKLSGYPAVYWKDYATFATPEAFEGLLVPIFEKSYSPEDIKSLTRLFGSPEFKALMEKHPDELHTFMERNPGMLKGKAFEAFSTYMSEAGKKLQEKHGIKPPAAGKK